MQPSLPENDGFRLRARRSDDTVAIEVQDTGYGIDSFDLPAIFEPFAQGARGKQAGGACIGLSLSAVLARTMSGELTASSKVGRGSTFVVRLPAAPESTQPAER